MIDRFTEVLGLERFAIYVFDYGAPVGLRLAARHPERITAIISQNGNAYTEGLSDGWAPVQAYWRDPTPANREAVAAMVPPETTIWQYTHGVPDDDPGRPDGYTLDNYYLARPGADEIQLDLLLDYASNIDSCTRPSSSTSAPASRRCWRSGAATTRSSSRPAPRRSSATSRRPTCGSFDTGHFALETHADEIADAIIDFLGP